MTRRGTVYALALLALCLGLVLTGCLIEGADDPERGEGDVSFDLEFDADGRYRVEGRVLFQLAAPSDVEFEDVMLCAYDERGRLLNSTSLGTFEPPADQASVELRFSARPRYLVVDHPKFEEYPRFFTGLVEWTDDTIRAGDGIPESDISEFDYRRPSTPGECYEPA